MTSQISAREPSRVQEVKKLLGRNILRIISKGYPAKTERNRCIYLLKGLGISNCVLAKLSNFSEQAIGKILVREKRSDVQPKTMRDIKQAFQECYYAGFRFDLDDSLADELKRRIEQFHQDCFKLLDARKRK